MSVAEEATILAFLGIIMLILLSIVIVSRFGRSHVTRIKYNKINRRKILIWYIKTQGFFLFLKIIGSDLSWYSTLIIPLILISAVVLNYFSSPEIDSKIVNTPEYQDQKKSIDRENKINKILR